MTCAVWTVYYLTPKGQIKTSNHYVWSEESAQRAFQAWVDCNKPHYSGYVFLEAQCHDLCSFQNTDRKRTQ